MQMCSNFNILLQIGTQLQCKCVPILIIYYKLGRNCNTYAFHFVIINYKFERYHKLERNRWGFHDILEGGQTLCVDTMLSQEFNKINCVI